MARTLTEKLFAAHVDGPLPPPGEGVDLRIAQTLTQDATGTLVLLQFETLGLDRVRTELSAQYVDHNLIQADNRNPDDHRFLASACRRWGIAFSRPGNGVSHPVHMERFGVPGVTLLGSDSHTCAAGSLGMLAMGAGGLDVALAMAGLPFRVARPRVLGVRLHGRLPAWVSAKDVILELLRRRGVDGCLGFAVEYHGPGVSALTAMDRHVIANMGQETGATTSVFPSDAQTRAFLKQQGREADWRELAADDGAAYDEEEEIDLGALEPLVALPSSPGNVVTVAEVAGRPIGQAYVGSSANPGLRDFAVPALMVAGRVVHPDVSLDINPSSRQVLEILIEQGHLARLVRAGARIHQAGCNGCIGMGQAPATESISLRTVPRNFPGRSGTREDQVYLCSPETATASALTGVITDPRTLDFPCPDYAEPTQVNIDADLLSVPEAADADTAIVKGPNIASLPELAAPPDRLRGRVALKVGDDVSTDEILPAGAQVLPLRSNLPAISEYVFRDLAPDFVSRAHEIVSHGDCLVVVGGRNYGQGSSREHAALAPRYLGLRLAVAGTFARIHARNLVNFGVLPLQLDEPADGERIAEGDTVQLDGVRDLLQSDRDHAVLACRGQGGAYEVPVRVDLDRREREIVLAGGRLNLARRELGTT